MIVLKLVSRPNTAQTNYKPQKNLLNVTLPFYSQYTLRCNFLFIPVFWMNRIPKRIWCSCQKYVFFSHLGYRPPVVCQFCWECASHTNDVICPNVTQVRAEPPAELFFRSIKQRQAQNCGGPQLSWQNRKPHGKNKNITAKTKYLTAKPKTSRQKQKYLTAKPKTSRQNQILQRKNKIALVLSWVFAFPISGNAFDTREKATRGRLFSRGVIFMRACVSLALLSLRKNGGLLVVYL